MHIWGQRSQQDSLGLAPGGRAGAAQFGNGGGPRAMRFPAVPPVHPQTGTEGPGRSRQHFLLRAIEQRSPTSEWAGSELIPVTRRSGTLTTNSIENRLAIKAQNGKPPSLGGYLTNCLTDKYIKMILKLESLEVEVKLRKSNQNVN